MRYTFADAVERDLDDIVAFYSRDNPNVAARFIAQVRRAKWGLHSRDRRVGPASSTWLLAQSHRRIRRGLRNPARRVTWALGSCCEKGVEPIF